LVDDISLKEGNRKYKILLVVPYTLPAYSGSGINAFHFARFLSREKQKTTLMTFNRNLRLKSKEEVDGVLIRRVSYFNRNLLTKGLSMFIIFPAYLVQILKHDIILIYGAHIIGYQVIVFFGKLLRRQIIFRSLLMGDDDMETIQDSRGGILRAGNRTVFDNISLYFAINPVFADKYKTHVSKPQKIVVSPQGFDPDYFHPVSEKLHKGYRENKQINEDCFVLLSVGFLIPRKGYSEIFEVLSGLDFNFRYYIVGEYIFGRDHFLSGVAMEAMKIKEYGEQLLGQRIHIEGPQKKLTEYYQMADMVVFNSTQEGISNALLEAMACGKPVLTRECPGLRDYLIFHKKNGLLFQNRHEMGTWINEIYQNKEFADELGAAAADFIHREANFNMVWTRLLKGLYSNQNR
jgi:glycosyltransferase involved in cell wall biosynthesis